MAEEQKQHPEATRPGPGQALTLLLLGACLLGLALFQGWGQLRVQGWQAAQGVVLESRVIGEGESARPLLRYRYSVNQQLRDGEAITPDAKACPIRLLCIPLGVGFQGEADAQALVERYPADEAAILYFNPGNPDEAVLERRLHWLIPGLGLAGLLLMLAGLLRWWR